MTTDTSKKPRGRNGGRRPRSPEAGRYEKLDTRVPPPDAAAVREGAAGHPDGVSGLLRDIIHEWAQSQTEALTARKDEHPLTTTQRRTTPPVAR